MSGNLKHVREMSGIMLTVRELSGKSQGKIIVRENCPKTLHCWLNICIPFASFVSITQMLEGFLTAFQRNASMAPYLYDDLMEVVKSLMRRCVKPEVIEKATTAAQLMKIDLDDSKNLLSHITLYLEYQHKHRCRKLKLLICRYCLTRPAASSSLLHQSRSC